MHRAAVRRLRGERWRRVVTAPHGGIVRGFHMAPGDVVREGYPIVFIQEAEVAGGAVAAVVGPDPDHVRDDLRENYDRHAFGLDENRPDAVARRRTLGYRMPRENIDRLVDPGSFKEYWPSSYAESTAENPSRAPQNTPGDGGRGMGQQRTLVDETRPARRRHYDYTVWRPEGARNHYSGRIFELAAIICRWSLFGEGGGGRPGGMTRPPRRGICDHVTTFSHLAAGCRWSQSSWRTFAVNTRGRVQRVIMRRGSTSNGVPAMIESGGWDLHARGCRAMSSRSRRRSSTFW